MAPCRTSPAPTPLQLSLRGQPSLQSWLSRWTELSVLFAKATSRKPDELAAAHEKIAAAFHSLEHDGEVDANTSAAEALQILRTQFPDMHAATVRLLANADRCLGRKKFLRVFAPDSVPRA